MNVNVAETYEILAWEDRKSSSIWKTSKRNCREDKCKCGKILRRGYKLIYIAVSVVSGEISLQ